MFVKLFYLSDISLTVNIEALNLGSVSSIPFHHGVPHVAGLVNLRVARHHTGLLQPQCHGVDLRQPDPSLEVLCLRRHARQGVQAGAGSVLHPLMRPEGVRDAPHLDVGPVPVHVFHNGVHQVVVVMPGVVAVHRSYLVENGRPESMNTPSFI